MNLLLIILLIIFCLGGLPNIGPIDHPWGYTPSGISAVLLIVLLILLLTGRL